jgi:hypothetical protein
MDLTEDISFTMARRDTEDWLRSGEHLAPRHAASPQRPGGGTMTTWQAQGDPKATWTATGCGPVAVANRGSSASTLEPCLSLPRLRLILYPGPLRCPYRLDHHHRTLSALGLRLPAALLSADDAVAV